MSENIHEQHQIGPVEGKDDTVDMTDIAVPLLGDFGRIGLRAAFAGGEGFGAQDNQEDVDRLTARLTTTGGSEGS